MLIFLTLLYFFNNSNLGTGASPLSSIPIHDPTLFLHNRQDPDPVLGSSCPDRRSALNIVWSCLSTIFICTWVSVHPNVPAPGDGKAVILGRRLALMIVALMAPEAIVIWAFVQREAAKGVAERFKGRGWTMTHGFFLSMGGFHLHEGKKDLGVLTRQGFEALFNRGEINFPSATREDIEDTSKADGLSKAIAILQTSWFISQCFARAVQKLSLTELEVFTIALASLNAVVYLLWWHKPLDAQRYLTVYKNSSSIPSQTESVGEGETEGESGGLLDPMTKLSTSTAQSREGKEGDLGGVVQRWQGFLRACVSFAFAPLRILYHVFKSAGLALFEFCSKGTKPNPEAANRVYVCHGGGEDVQDWVRMLFVFALPPLFGGIHCLAWNFSFPTKFHRCLWRVMSLALVFNPPIYFGIGLMLDHKPRQQWLKNFVAILRYLIWFILFIWYIVARLCLMIQAFILLAKLPPNALLDVHWADFIPHL